MNRRNVRNVARNVPALGLLLGACALALNAATSHAQSSNGTYTVIQDTVSSAGGRVGGGNPISAQTILGLPASGNATNGVFTLLGGFGTPQAVCAEPPTTTVTVTGTVNDATATVTVNGITATVSGGTFTAADVTLTLGSNTITAIATDGLGNQTSHAIMVYLDLPDAQKQPMFSIDVTGTTADPSATVSVNGVPATVTSGQFTASVPLVSGLNTLTATAVDTANNSVSDAVRVFVPPCIQPPPMPTVGTVGPAIPTVTTDNQVTIGGTKTPGTSIWINGAEVVPQDDLETWTTTLPLVEGDNEFTIVAKDAGGTPSAEVLINVIRDADPPVVTFNPPAKTNFNPLLLTGTVDDSLTTVTINGIVATRTGRTFEVSLPLVLGSNLVDLVAISPNNFTTTQSATIVLGTIPTVDSVSPLDATIVYATQTITLSIIASDLELDPIEYQFLIDGTVLADWSASASQPWTPTLTDIGVRTIQINVRDAYGGSNTQSLEAMVIRIPVQHP